MTADDVTTRRMVRISVEGPHDNDGVLDMAYLFLCPGCDFLHCLWGHEWWFNGDFTRPTLRPLVFKPPYRPFACSFQIVDGYVRFAKECGHDMAGWNVELPRFHPRDFAEPERVEDIYPELREDRP